MPTRFDNDADFEKEFMRILTEMADVIIGKLYEKLVGDKGFIQKIIYDRYEPKAYERQWRYGGLAGEYYKTTAKKRNPTEVYASIKADPTTLTYHPEEFIHGSKYRSRGKWVITDIRDGLIPLIVEGTSGPLFGEGFWRQKRDFWTPFVEYMDANSAKFTETEFRKRRIPFVRIS